MFDDDGISTSDPGADRTHDLRFRNGRSPLGGPTTRRNNRDTARRPATPTPRPSHDVVESGTGAGVQVSAEEWRPVPDYEGRYEVSSLGRVRSVFRTDGPRILSQSVCHAYGYLGVSITKEGKAQRRKVHVLVALAFLGPRPPGMQAAHRDGNNQNNRLSNLEWLTPKQNAADRVRHGTQARGTAYPHAKLDEEKVLEIRRRSAAGERQVDIAADYGIDRSLIVDIAQGRCWAHVGGPIRGPLKSKRYRQPDAAGGAR